IDINEISGGTEEQAEPREEMPSPHFALRQNRRKPCVEPRRHISERSDAQASQKTNDERQRGCPVEDNSPDVAAGRAGARSALSSAGTALACSGLAADRARERLIIAGDIVHHGPISPSPLSVVLRGQRAPTVGR